MPSSRRNAPDVGGFRPQLADAAEELAVVPHVPVDVVKEDHLRRLVVAVCRWLVVVLTDGY
jgi:hypothetical protein